MDRHFGPYFWGNLTTTILGHIFWQGNLPAPQSHINHTIYSHLIINYISMENRLINYSENIFCSDNYYCCLLQLCNCVVVWSCGSTVAREYGVVFVVATFIFRFQVFAHRYVQAAACRSCCWVTAVFIMRNVVAASTEKCFTKSLDK